MHFLLILAGVLLATHTSAETAAHKKTTHTPDAYAAVATNFRATAEHLLTEFHSQSPYRLALVSGSTGKLFNQVKHGAPYDLFLSADEDRAQRLIDEGLAVPNTRATYALGQLVLIGQTTVGQQELQESHFRNLAMANPKLAPYGLAAAQTLASLELSEKLADKIVMGENVGQAYAMVVTGNAEIGLVAYSLIEPANIANVWLIPGLYHDPIKQDLVLLNHGQANPAAIAFREFILSCASAEIIEAAGYSAVRQ
jgi:molybdate transport system substrate-binding protein